MIGSPNELMESYPPNEFGGPSGLSENVGLGGTGGLSGVGGSNPPNNPTSLNVYESNLAKLKHLQRNNANPVFCQALFDILKRSPHHVLPDLNALEHLSDMTKSNSGTDEFVKSIRQKPGMKEITIPYTSEEALKIFDNDYKQTFKVLEAKPKPVFKDVCYMANTGRITDYEVGKGLNNLERMLYIRHMDETTWTEAYTKIEVKIKPNIVHLVKDKFVKP